MARLNLSKGTSKILWVAMSSKFPCFSQIVHCWVGDGIDTYFCEDPWLGDRPFCSLFSRLYHLTSMRGPPVASFLPSLGNRSSLLVFVVLSETNFVVLITLLGDFVVNLGSLSLVS